MPMTAAVVAASRCCSRDSVAARTASQGAAVASSLLTNSIAALCCSAWNDPLAELLAGAQVGADCVHTPAHHTGGGRGHQPGGHTADSLGVDVVQHENIRDVVVEEFSAQAK